MNCMLNRLDNFRVIDKSYEFIPQEVKHNMNIDGRILATDGKFIVLGKDAMLLIKKSRLQEQIGRLEYDALMRKPMIAFLLASYKDDSGKTKEELDNKYGIMAINFNNFAQAFSIGCWFIKDSCISATNMYWFNLFNGYNSKLKRDMPITLSTGEINEVSLDDIEMKEAIERMYEVYRYLLPNESNMGRVESSVSNGTVFCEIDKAISTEGKSFARALIKLQEARRTGALSSKIEKYCSMLECLFVISGNNKKNIANITAVYIGKDDLEKELIRNDMRKAYSIRSDGIHGSSLEYLKKNNQKDLRELSHKLDEYVRKVFRKILKEPTLNCDGSSKDKNRIETYFMKKAKEAYPNEYKKYDKSRNKNSNS